MTLGYAQEGYARSLAEFGTVEALPRSGGWILQRPVPGSVIARDAMGCYPLFCCHDWGKLGEDLDEVGDRLVSLAVVPDPFGNHDEGLLRRWFPDRMIQFKRHWTVDFARPVAVSRHHRYYAQRSLQRVSVEVCSSPLEYLQEWNALYGVLIRRHGIAGIRAFSPAAFASQLGLPGMRLLIGICDGQVVGGHLWMEGTSGVAYSHLTAFSEKGYEVMASYALYSRAIDYFGERGFRFLDLGADAGVGRGRGGGGLSFFKKGWSNGERAVFFCGRIFDRARYEELAAAGGQPAASYFPAYRAGEF